MRHALSLLLFWSLSLFSRPALPAESIWVEGEDAEGERGRRHPWYDRVRSDDLSGGDWFSHFDAGREGNARYRVEVAESASYTFWLRANPVQAKLSYRVDGGEWRRVETGKREGPVINIADDDKPDLRFVAWLNLGSIDLKAGKHRIEFRLHSDSHNHGGIDCFALTTAPWKPSGTLKPGERRASWPAPELTDRNYAEWIRFIRPDEDDLAWRKVRWHRSLAAAAKEARELRRPILLWTMNGHPCGET